MSRFPLAIVSCLAACVPGPLSADDSAAAGAAAQAVGIEKRTPWTTSRIHGTPDPPSPYRTDPAFPHLKFDEPLALCAVPHSNRLAVAERYGKVYTFENDPATQQKELLVDVGRTVYGLAFHPNFGQNGFFYVTSVLNPQARTPDGSRISRFHVPGAERLRADADSETVILTWPSGDHNGGCIRFGPDGYLYLATGDGSGIADQLQTGQDVSDLLASILRIDVDHTSDGRHYSVPADNPFVDRAGARPEIWSYGHRQVWKFSFDREGQLWAGEVGQDLWEMVYVVQKGGNYGWSVQEGSHPFRPQRQLGPTPILPPLVEHPHSDFRSLTGGYVYYGARLPEIAGSYIYGDYDMGRIWGLKYDGQRVLDHRELADTQLRIVEIGQDLAGEVYFVDLSAASSTRWPLPYRTLHHQPRSRRNSARRACSRRRASTSRRLGSSPTR